jgi:hypothetical protein
MGARWGIAVHNRRVNRAVSAAPEVLESSPVALRSGNLVSLIGALRVALSVLLWHRASMLFERER